MRTTASMLAFYAFIAWSASASADPIPGIPPDGFPQAIVNGYDLHNLPACLDEAGGVNWPGFASWLRSQRDQVERLTFALTGSHTKGSEQIGGCGGPCDDEPYLVIGRFVASPVEHIFFIWGEGAGDAPARVASCQEVPGSPLLHVAFHAPFDGAWRFWLDENPHSNSMSCQGSRSLWHVERGTRKVERLQAFPMHGQTDCQAEKPTLSWEASLKAVRNVIEYRLKFTAPLPNECPGIHCVRSAELALRLDVEGKKVVLRSCALTSQKAWLDQNLKTVPALQPLQALIAQVECHGSQ